MSLFPGFERRRVRTSGATTHLVMAGAGEPLLMLHGYPQTHACWHRTATALARRYAVVCADLRGYGDSSNPKGLSDARSEQVLQDGRARERARERALLQGSARNSRFVRGLSGLRPPARSISCTTATTATAPDQSERMKNRPQELLAAAMNARHASHMKIKR